MKTIYVLPVLLALMSSAAFASTGTDGHGGGTICLNGKCKTLAESGFKLSAVQFAQEIPTDLLNELDAITKLLPKLMKLSTEEVIGKRGDIIFVDAVDNRKIKSFYDQYKALLIKNGQENLKDKLNIPAFTVGAKTYLIKDKFLSSQLSNRTRALILIHEKNLRDIPNYQPPANSFELVLRFDEYLVGYLDAVSKRQSQNFDLFGFILAAKNLPGMSQEKNKYDAYLLGDVIRRVGPISTVDFFGYEENRINNWGAKPYRVSYEQMLRNRVYDPRLAQTITHDELLLQANFRRELVAEFSWYIHDQVLISGNTYVVTQKDVVDFFNYEKNVHRRISKNLTTIMMQENLRGLCKDSNDKADYLVAVQEKNTPDFYTAQSLTCNPYFGPQDQIFAMSVGAFATRIQGLSFNFVAPIVCKRPGGASTYPDCK